MRELSRIYENEKYHTQWLKQFLNVAIFFSLLLVTLFRGSKNSESIFGIEVCSWESWSSLGLFAMICLFVSYYSLKKA